MKNNPIRLFCIWTVVQKEMSLARFIISSTGGPYVRQNIMICVFLVEYVMVNTPVSISNLKQGFRRCCLTKRLQITHGT